MKKNMGALDKRIRVLIAVIIGFLYGTNIITGAFGLILSILAIIFLITSFISYCPLYTPFGINTNKKRHDKYNF